MLRLGQKKHKKIFLFIYYNIISIYNKGKEFLLLITKEIEYVLYSWLNCRC